MAIKLPNRKWYTLQQAADKLTRESGEPVTVEDLIHYAYIGDLELCIDVYYDNTDSKQNFNENRIKNCIIDDKEYALEIDDFVFVEDESDILREPKKNFYINEKYYNISMDTDERSELKLNSYKGLLSFYIEQEQSEDNILTNGFLINKTTEYGFKSDKGIFETGGHGQAFYTPRKSEQRISISFGYFPDINKVLFEHEISLDEAKAYKEQFDYFISNTEKIYIPTNLIIITADELDLLKNGGEYKEKPEIHKKQSSKTVNSQARFIRDLIAVHYGNDQLEKVRQLVNNGELADDFSNKGLTPPTGEAVARWVNQVLD